MLDTASIHIPLGPDLWTDIFEKFLTDQKNKFQMENLF